MKFFVPLNSNTLLSSATSDVDIVLCPDKNLLTGLSDFQKSFPTPTSLEADLLHLAAAVFACDLAHKRSERERYTRNFELEIEVVNYQGLNARKSDLEYLLYVLSQDNWEIKFTAQRGQPEPTQQWLTGKGKTLLFSGGLDSLAGAVDIIDSDGAESLQLASHQTGNTTNRHAQTELVKYLQDHYQKELAHVTIRTGGKPHEEFNFPKDDEREGSQRTRSFMFLTIGALAARRTGRNTLVMLAENGQMAIHLPLTAGRIGAFSTHTAHPEFISEATSFFAQVLNYSITVENFYLYKTKAEVVSKLVSHHRDAIPISTSCWKNARVAQHCGECVPCFVRRVALEANGLSLNEFGRDLFNENIEI